MEKDQIWVFHGAGGRFASAVFDSQDKAETWIISNKLEGVLTSYPLNVPVYDWALANGYLRPEVAEKADSVFIQRFTSAAQEHYHFEND